MIKCGMKEILKMALVITGFIIFIFAVGFGLFFLVALIASSGSAILTILSIVAALFVFVLSFLTGLYLATSL